MLAPATTRDFLNLVRKSGLVDDARVAELFPDDSNLPPDPKTCALGLVKQGVLTQYQAKMLVNGKSRGFFVGPYVIEGPIGQGGMGIVYRARHTSLGRHVALKILPSDQARDQLTLNRFLREARAAAALDHPNIVRLYDVGQGTGLHFLVMEYVDGTNVQTLLEKSGALEYRQAADYVAQAAAGLKHAHQRGIVHRDIKPANLMVTKDGRIKILDMGLARSLRDEKDNLTALHGTGDITGTADYISPEHLLGEVVDERSDLYSLGATLFSLLLGRPPYVGTTTQKLVQHQLKDSAELRNDLQGKVPLGLADVVVGMMAKRKSERYQSAKEVIEALAPWLPGAPSGKAARSAASTRTVRATATKPQGSTARRAKRERKVSLPAGRKKWIMIGGAVGFVALIGGLALAFGNGGKNTATANSPAKNAPAPLSPATGGLPGGLTPPAIPPADPPAMRAHTSGINDMVFGRDGLLCAVDWSGHLIIWDPKAGRPARSFAVRPGTKLNACATTPDGRQVVVVGEKIPVLVLDWETGQTVRELAGHAGTTWGVAVSPSGREVLTCGTDGVVLLRDLRTGDEIRRFQFEAKQIWGVAFSADGSRMAACGARGPSENESYLIRVWEAANGRELHKLTGHTRDVRWVTFGPSGETLASAGFDGTVRLWDLKSGSETRTIVAHSGYTERVFFLPGGKRLVSCGGPLANSKDAGEGGTIKFWNAETGHEVGAWKGAATTDLIALALSLDGTQVATGSRDKIVRIWPLSVGRGN
jgi:WD40 repeat protein/tRNA A-37 threonylcarbamoyl transferase component Bud32